MEPGLPSVTGDSPEFTAANAAAAPLLEAGDIEGAHSALFEIIVPGFRARCDETLPPGWFERWLAASERVLFPSDLPELNGWQFTAEDAAQITVPVLNGVGANTASVFSDVHETVQSWIPHAQSATVAGATHCMLQEKPRASAEILADFFARHPIPR